LRLQLEEARDMLRRAEEASKDGYYGSDRWLEHHKSTVDRLSQLCTIIDDSKVPAGSVIQLSPPQSTTKQVMQQHRVVALDEADRKTSLLTSATTSMGE
jgi:hypothetical protein